MAKIHAFALHYATQTAIYVSSDVGSEIATIVLNKFHRIGDADYRSLLVPVVRILCLSGSYATTYQLANQLHHYDLDDDFVTHPCHQFRTNRTYASYHSQLQAKYHPRLTRPTRLTRTDCLDNPE